MTRKEFILDQMQRAYAGEAWHGDSLKELLAGVDGAAAAARPVPGGHNIWELVEHIGAWMKAAIRRMHSDPAKLSPEEDWAPSGDLSEAAWERTLAKLEADHNRLKEEIRTLPEASLDNIVPGKTHSIEFLLHGILQHTLYHCGQIALLKKAAIAPETLATEVRVA